MILWVRRGAAHAALTGWRMPGTYRRCCWGITFSGIVVSASCHLFTEFRTAAVRRQGAGTRTRATPDCARHHGAGRCWPGRSAPEICRCFGIFLAALLTPRLNDLTPTQFTVAVMILSLFALVFGFI